MKTNEQAMERVKKGGGGSRHSGSQEGGRQNEGEKAILCVRSSMNLEGRRWSSFRLPMTDH